MELYNDQEPPEDESLTRRASLALGRAVRERRLAANWTVDQLVTRSGVSKGAIVAVEHGATNPNLSTLVRLADALGAPVSELLGDTPDDAVQIVAHDALPPLWRGAAGSSAALILTVPGVSPVELWLWRLAPGERYTSHPHPPAVVETITPLSGAVELTVDGERWTVAAGATATFAADRGHAYAAGAEETVFLMTVHLRAPRPSAPGAPLGEPGARQISSSREEVLRP